MTDPRARIHEAAYLNAANRGGGYVGFAPARKDMFAVGKAHCEATRHAVTVNVSIAASSWKCDECEAGETVSHCVVSDVMITVD